MESASFFKVIDIPNEFERFFSRYYLLWETDWIRQKKYVGTSYYAIEGNLQTWKEYYLKEHFVLLKYFVNDEAVGYLSYRIENDSIQLEALLLLPEFRGKGLMAHVLRSFYQHLKTEKIDCSTIYLETNASNPSNKVYVNFGFKVVETRRNDRENGEDTLVYRIEKTSKPVVPKLIQFHRVALIACAALMANPFFLLIMTSVYGLMIFPYWFHKLPIKNKIWWTIVPISLPWVFWGTLSIFVNLIKFYQWIN
jgi:ribosomal protein S18 acetylase RimI-like enzyme